MSNAFSHVLTPYVSHWKGAGPSYRHSQEEEVNGQCTLWLFSLIRSCPYVNLCLSSPSGLKYEKAKEWKIHCVNAQWLCDILLGNFDALRQIQHSRYSNYNHAEPLVPNQLLVHNLLGMYAFMYLLKINYAILRTKVKEMRRQRQVTFSNYEL